MASCSFNKQPEWLHLNFLRREGTTEENAELEVGGRFFKALNKSNSIQIIPKQQPTSAA